MPTKIEPHQFEPVKEAVRFNNCKKEMKNKIPGILSITLLFLAFIINTSSFAGDDRKIGVVDLRRIIKTTQMGQSTKIEIEKVKNDFQSDLNKRKAEIEKLKREFAGGALVLEQTSIEEKERQLRIMLNDYRELKTDYQNQFREQVKVIDQRIRERITEAAERYGKEQGYLIILEKHEAGILYFPEAVDITHAIAKEINRKPWLSGEKKVD